MMMGAAARSRNGSSRLHEACTLRGGYGVILHKGES